MLFRDKKTIILQKAKEQCIVFEYKSDRKIISPGCAEIGNTNAFETLKEYNHMHKINITLVEEGSNIVYQMF